jgi:hypothetical protein
MLLSFKARVTVERIVCCKDVCSRFVSARRIVHCLRPIVLCYEVLIHYIRSSCNHNVLLCFSYLWDIVSVIRNYVLEWVDA